MKFYNWQLGYIPDGLGCKLYTVAQDTDHYQDSGCKLHHLHKMAVPEITGLIYFGEVLSIFISNELTSVKVAKKMCTW